MDDKEKIKIGKELVNILNIRRTRFVGLYHTKWGSKTPLGIYKTVRKIMKLGGEKMSIYDGILEMLDFQGFEIDKIINVTANAGGCWFNYGNKDYFTTIGECEATDETSNKKK